MDAQIAPAAVRPADDGPAYDLVSLGLVLFTILLIGVWTPYFFRQEPARSEDFSNFTATLDLTTSAGNLQAARWAEFNLRGTDGTDISFPFRNHLKDALELEAAERANLFDQLERLPPDRTIAARVELNEHPTGPAELFARQWYAHRAAWLDARDTRGFDKGAHEHFAGALREIGLEQEANLEIEKILRVDPDWPLADRADKGLPVTREHGQADETK